MSMAAPNGNSSEYDLFSSQSMREREEYDELGIPERRMIQAGKKQHRETTDSTRRSLQVAEQTIEIASSTLVEVQRQGQSLSKIEFGIETMEKDVHEANRIVRFMRRWCCFQMICCCDCFDPGASADATRKRTTQERMRQQAALEEGLAMQHQSQQQKAQRLSRRGDPAFNGDEDAARSELFAARLANKTQNTYNTANDATIGIGYGLPPKDAQELRDESRQQDEYLHRIGTAVDTLKVMSKDLQGELEQHIPQIDAMQERTHTTHDILGALTRTTKKI